MDRRLALFALALAFTAAPGLARAEPDAAADDKAADDAEPAQTVVVLPYAPLFGEIPQSQADKSTELVKNELVANKQFKVVDAAEGKSKKAGKSWEEDLAGARKEVDEAERTFEKAGELAKNKKMKPAADACEKGIQQFLLNFQGADDFKALSDAYVLLSITRFKLGNEEEAIKILDDVVRVDPSRVLQPPEVVNLFAKLHDKARKAYLDKARGQLKVTSVPAGARVTLDGRDIGETPLLGKGIVPGEHYLKVVKAGQGAFWKKVTVASGEQTELKAELSVGASGPLAGIAKTLQGNVLDDKLVREVQKIGEGSKADFVVFGAMRKGDDSFLVKTFALQVKSGNITMLAPLTFDTEMLGAGIEVFKLASDLGEKVKEFTGTRPDGELPLWSDAKPTQTEEQLNLVTVTGTAGSAGGPAIPQEEGEKHGRRVIASAAGDAPPVTESRRPIAAVEPEKKAVDETRPPEEEKVVRRVRGRIGEAPPVAEKKVEEKKVEPEEPKIARRDDGKKPKSVLDEVVAEEDDKPKAKAPEAVDLRPKLSTKSSDLSIEDYKRLQELEQKDGEGSGTGKVVLWSAVGVAGAAGLGYLGYVLLAPKTPTSATAKITWAP